MARIVIIGGGVSGLSAGIYARLSGHSAVIVERHGILGGNLTGWDREGYHIDNCIHWLTGTNKRSRTYKRWLELSALGGVRVYQPESLYTYEGVEGRLTLYRNIEKTRAEMLRLSPEDKREINSLFSAVELLKSFFGISEERGIISAVFSSPLLLKYYRMSTEELAARFRSPLIGAFLTSFLSECFGALALLTVFAHFCADNGGIPAGGSTAMAKRMTERFLSLGGEVMTGCCGEKLIIEGGVAKGLRLKGGEYLSADYFVLTTDPKVAFGGMIDLPMPRSLQKKYSDERLFRFSSLHTAIGLDSEKVPFSGDLILGGVRENEGNYPSPRVIFREFSHEKSFSPKGKNLIQSMCFLNEEMAREFVEIRKNDPAAYRRKKREFGEMTLHILLQKFPEMKGKLRLLDVWTPATYRRYTGSEIGSWMSFILPKRMLPLRSDNRVKGAKNLILATQWQQIPGGLPIAAEGGRLAIKRIDAMGLI